MTARLSVTIGQRSSAGAKPANQDFHGAIVPEGALLTTKGIAVAIADGISSSPVGAVASETAVKSFLMDYYCTSDAWSVKTSAERVLAAANSWLHAQNGRVLDDAARDRGHVCTFSAIVFKSRTAHLFHIGDARIYRLAGMSLEPLTEDHRVVISSRESYLARAMGANAYVEIDYRAVGLQPGEVFILTTDGVYEHVAANEIAACVSEHSADLDAATRKIVDLALTNGSKDNLTIQIVRVDALPDGGVDELLGNADALPPAPLLEPRMQFEGYEIIRPIHSSARSHIYLARDSATGARVALKVPSVEMRENTDHLKHLMMEEWIARRLNDPHVLKAAPQTRAREHLFTATEFVEGETLAQWMLDHPRADLATVRGMVVQIAAGLQAFHRKEMIHQDLRPQNILIDRDGTVKLIDFGSCWVAGVAEAIPQFVREDVLGTAQYMAPEYFLGTGGTEASDIYSLGVIAYQMLTGRLPYGPRVANLTTRAGQRRLQYRPAVLDNPAVPDWMDAALAKAVHVDPARRHAVLSEFTFDLRNPNPALQRLGQPPLLQRNPLLAWRTVAALLFALVILLAWIDFRR